MIVDLEQLVSPVTVPQKSGVCIAGAGVAGLVLAVALADAGVDVHLLEAGGREEEDRSQEIYSTEMAGITHAGATVGRARVFGGSSTRWGGQILPFTTDVFSPPPELTTFSWPVSAAKLEPFYRTIESILGTNHLPYSTELLSGLGISLPRHISSSPDVAVRFSKWAPFSNRNVAKSLGVKAIASKRITVFLHANLTECLLASDGSRIEAFLVRNYRGDYFRFAAKRYVLATGTIETSRLLLASRSVCKSGVGNARNQVGLKFHDHVSAPVGEVKPNSQSSLLPWMLPFFVGETTHTAKLEASIELRRKLKLPAVMAHLEIREPDDSAAFLLRDLLRAMQRGNSKSVILDNYRRLPPACFEMLRFVYNARIRKRRSVSSAAKVLIHVVCEQSACPKNRIRLAERTLDPLGVPRAVIDWRVSEHEMQSMRRYAQWIRADLNDGQEHAVTWYDDAVDGRAEALPDVRDTNHPMGGTVMGLDPANSVVDSDLRVHGVSNLYVASCSTFPSGSSSNPTFTLMALTLRLGEQLSQLSGSCIKSSCRPSTS